MGVVSVTVGDEVCSRRAPDVLTEVLALRQNYLHRKLSFTWEIIVIYMGNYCCHRASDMHARVLALSRGDAVRQDIAIAVSNIGNTLQRGNKNFPRKQ